MYCIKSILHVFCLKKQFAIYHLDINFTLKLVPIKKLSPLFFICWAKNEGLVAIKI